MLMTSEEYVKSATVTESRDHRGISNRLGAPETQRLLHGSIGLATEAGEMLDAVKKHVFYGAPLDKVNMAEEVGDLFWYCAVICDALNVSFEEVQEKNIAKLKARYGAMFSKDRALHRDLEKERKVLET
jgi:NTP pyrophosphatase (non-canonical NTP hydrolase)